MLKKGLRECLVCGMQVAATATHCPKCDAVLHLQTDGSILHIDIAHQQETVQVALGKLDSVLEEARMGQARAVRVVVGRGLIKEEVLLQLSWLKRSGEILAYGHEGDNTGAVLISIRR